MSLPICGECAKVAAVRVITRCGEDLRSELRCDSHAQSYLDAIGEPDGVGIDLTVYEVHRLGGSVRVAARA